MLIFNILCVLDVDVIQTTRDWKNFAYDRFTQFRKIVPANLCKQLRNVTSGQVQVKDVTVTVFRVFEDGEDVIRLRSKSDQLASLELKWKSFEDRQDTDVTIVAGDGELINCHGNYITSKQRFIFLNNWWDLIRFTRYEPIFWQIENSPVLSNLLVPPPRKKLFVLETPELGRNGVEAFLNYQYNGASDKILESPSNSLGALKASESYEIWQMWSDTMEGLLRRDSGWFEGEVVEEFYTFLVQCSKRGEETTQNLINKVFLAMRRQRSKELVRMLESPTTSISFLKVAQSYKNDDMWNDIISTLLEKCSNWFEGSLELKTYLDTCDKRDEKATRKLARMLSRLLQQTRADDGTGNEHCHGIIENGNTTVGSPPKSATVNRNVRRSARLHLGKRKAEGLHTEGESRKRTLQVSAKKKKPAPKPSTSGNGPRDIRKDPLLPKIAIFLDPEVKVEKVEPPEEDGNEDPVEMAAVGNEHQFVHEMDAEAWIDEEPISMDNSSVCDFDVGEFGVVKLDIDGSN